MTASELNVNYFTLFGLPVRYAVDNEQLKARYHDLQRQYHPDNYAGHPITKQQAALSQSAMINQAWQTLRHPLSRAEYLLSLQGFYPSDQQHTICDSMFLTEQFQLREELDEIEHTYNDQRLKKFIWHIKKICEARYKQLIGELDSEDWNLAADTVHKLHFLDKLQYRAEQLVEKLSGF